MAEMPPARYFLAFIQDRTSGNLAREFRFNPLDP
jgi:hypothetical protein